MSKNFEELDSRSTPLGDISLRRRRLLQLDGLEIFEVKLNDEFLMSSLFHAAEDALADLGLAAAEGSGLEVVVGGLGLGYTARAALKSDRVASLRVVEILRPVIEWHERGLVPVGPELVADPRCQFVQGDFFAMAHESGMGFAPERPHHKFHAILLDIDHSPSHWLHPRHAWFYEPAGLRQLTTHLHPQGVFALWSNDNPDPEFIARMENQFADFRVHVVNFPNPLTGGSSSNTVYVARG